MLFKQNGKQTQYTPNLYTLIPKRELDWQESDEGNVELLKPKFSSERIQNILSKLMKQTHFKIKLDDLGSTVWKLIDGKRTIREIGEELQQKFGEKVEPVFDRLEQFISQLHRSKFISFYNL